jgi:hypothetical protein
MLLEMHAADTRQRGRELSTTASPCRPKNFLSAGVNTGPETCAYQQLGFNPTRPGWLEFAALLPKTDW